MEKISLEHDNTCLDVPPADNFIPLEKGPFRIIGRIFTTSHDKKSSDTMIELEKKDGMMANIIKNIKIILKDLTKTFMQGTYSIFSFPHFIFG